MSTKHETRNTKHETLLLIGMGALALVSSSGCSVSSVDSYEESSSSKRQLTENRSFVSVRIADLGGGAESEVPAKLSIRKMSGRERELLAGRKKALGPKVSVANPTERFKKVASESGPNDFLRVIVRLVDPDQGRFKLAAENADERAAAIAARRARLAPSQDALSHLLRQVGGKELYRAWLTNQVVAELPAHSALELAASPGIKEIVLDESNYHNLWAYGGEQARAGMLTNNLLSHGYDGNQGNRTSASSPIRIGIIEYADLPHNNEAWLNGSHVGYQDWAGGPYRVKKEYDCTTGTCYRQYYWGTPMVEPNHGSKVTMVAAGSIEQNQSTQFPGYGTWDQKLRSGQSRESEIYYYLIHWGSDEIAAINQAVADGADIVNMSYGGGNCEGYGHSASENPTLNAATNAGVLFVAAAGNNGSYSQGTCEVSYPAFHPNVLAVNGLDTKNQNQDYNTAILDDGASARGAVPARLWTGYSTTVSGIDLAAPGAFSYWYTPSANNDSYWTIWWAHGSSFASPAVAGAAANLKQALKDIGWPADSAKMLQVMLMVNGDAWDGLQAGNNDMSTGASIYSGLGRLHVHWPSTASITSPAGWGYRSFLIKNNETISWPVGSSGQENSATTQWKWALTWEEDDLNNLADIDISVWDTCPSGGGSPVMIASQQDYDTRNRIMLLHDDIAGKCLEMRAHGYSVPPEGRVVHSTDYFHSGNPANN